LPDQHVVPSQPAVRRSDIVGMCLLQAERNKELTAAAAAESEAITAALSQKMQEQEAASREVQRLRLESEELRQ